MYWAKPETDLPAEFHDEALRLRLAWNAMVELFWRRYNERNKLLRQDGVVDAMEIEVFKAQSAFDVTLMDFKQAKIDYAARKHFKSSDVDCSRLEKLRLGNEVAYKYLRALREMLKKERKRAAALLGVKGDTVEESANLAAIEIARYGFKRSDNRDGEALVQSFLNSRQKFLSGKGGPPRFKDWDSPLSFCIRYSGGGIPVDRLFNKNTRFYIDGIDEKRRGKFWWGLGASMCEFRTVLHRDLPKDAMVKSVRLVRDADRWQLSINVEEPPVEKLPHGDGVIHISMGWRTYREVPDEALLTPEYLLSGGLVVAEITVNGAVKPVYLFGSDYYHTDTTKLDLRARVKRIDELASKADGALDFAKAGLLRCESQIKALGWSGNLIKCKAHGLMRLLGVLIKCGHPFADELQRQLGIYEHYRREADNIGRRLRRYREWFYWNVAKRIAASAKVVIVKDIDLKQLGRKRNNESKPDDVAAAIRRLKSLAAPGELREKIKKQCAKHGVEVIEESLQKGGVNEKGKRDEREQRHRPKSDSQGTIQVQDDA